MKAYVLHGVGDLRYEEHPLSELQPGWALVRVLAAGICSSDIPRIFKKGTYHFPTIPGHEFCGSVEAVHDDADNVWIGKRVGVFPLIPCKNCPSCEEKKYETCRHYDYIGSRRDGGFAEYVAVPVWNLIELPDTVSDIQGALLEPAAVALHAVKRAGIRPGEQFCVVGTGAVGFLAGQWAKILGAEHVWVKGRNESKRGIAERCGLNYLSPNGPKDTFGCVLEAVGTEAAMKEALEMAAPGGRVVLLGNPDGDRMLPQNMYWSILRKQLTLVGTWNSSYGSAGSDWDEAVKMMGQLAVRPLITHTLAQSDLSKGLAVMRNRTEPYCKVIVLW